MEMELLFPSHHISMEEEGKDGHEDEMAISH